MTTATRSTKKRSLQIKHLTPALGARVDGLDLSKPLDDAELTAVRKALDDNLVLFFEDQSLTQEQHRDFAACFGDLYIHPVYPGDDRVPEIMVLAFDETRKGSNDTWHTDVTYIETPPQASVLYAEIIPELGGDTLWCNTYLAYESLSDPLKRLAGELRAVHSFAKQFTPSRFRQYGIEERVEQTYADNPPVSHPVVRTNPANGRKALFVNQAFTSHLEGVSASESRALLELFFEHLAQPEFHVRWHWKPNTVAFWDNRWTQHCALADYFPQKRRVRRATILGDRPV